MVIGFRVLDHGFRSIGQDREIEVGAVAVAERADGVGRAGLHTYDEFRAAGLIESADPETVCPLVPLLRELGGESFELTTHDLVVLVGLGRRSLEQADSVVAGIDLAADHANGQLVAGSFIGCDGDDRHVVELQVGIDLPAGSVVELEIHVAAVVVTHADERVFRARVQVHYDGPALTGGQGPGQLALQRCVSVLERRSADAVEVLMDPGLPFLLGGCRDRDRQNCESAGGQDRARTSGHGSFSS